MTIKNININGLLVQQTIVLIKGDGSCLFRSLSFLIYGNEEKAFDMREQIINFVKNNWDKFSVMSHDRKGNNYNTFDEYFTDMIQYSTYGTLCELVAAERIFNFVFEVYHNCGLYVKVGTEGCPVKRLRFSGDLADGNFKAYLSDGELLSEVPSNPSSNHVKAKKIRSRSVEVFEFDPLFSNNLNSDESTDCSSRKFNNLSALSQKTNKKRKARYSNKTRKYQLRHTKKNTSKHTRKCIGRLSLDITFR